MSKRDDVDSLYSYSARIGLLCKFLFWFNFFSALLGILINENLYAVLMYGQIISALLYVILNCIDDGLFWYRAEMARRKNNIQVGFDLPLSEIETEGYYNNSLAPSLIKYGVNTFESNYYSNFISGKMLGKSFAVSLTAFVALLVTGWLVESEDILLIIAQAVFSAYIIEDTIMLAIYKMRISHLYDEAYSRFVTAGVKGPKLKVWILSYVVEYEAIKAHYKVRLDSKLFNKYNDELSKNWNSILSKIYVS